MLCAYLWRVNIQRPIHERKRRNDGRIGRQRECVLSLCIRVTSDQCKGGAGRRSHVKLLPSRWSSMRGSVVTQERRKRGKVASHPHENTEPRATKSGGEPLASLLAERHRVTGPMHVYALSQVSATACTCMHRICCICPEARNASHERMHERAKASQPPPKSRRCMHTRMHARSSAPCHPSALWPRPHVQTPTGVWKQSPRPM